MRILRKGCFGKSLQYFFLILLTYAIWAAARWRWQDHKLWSTSIKSPPKVLFSTKKISNSSIFDIAVPYKKKWVGFPELTNLNCAAAFSNSVRNSVFAQQVNRITPANYIEDSVDCPTFRDKYGFHRYPKVSADELTFPIAFILLFNKDFDQVVFLLRAIYRSHNVYCLNVDSKAGQELLNAAKALARCVPNVFVASRLERIVYAGFSRLQADINCMGDLLQHPVRWRYVINMPGQQFPLRSNLEMVKIIQKYNGINDIEGITGRRMLPDRFLYKHFYVADPRSGDVVIKRSPEKLQPPPYGFEVIKGSAYGTFSRAFVAFVLHDRRAQDLLKWSQDVNSPDEYFWATLHHSKTVPVPGGYTAGKPDKKPWLTVYASWGGVDPCATIRRRSVCIFSPEDLPGLLGRRELFANKFYITHYPAALHCLDQMLYNLTASGRTRDLSFYDRLPFVVN